MNFAEKEKWATNVVRRAGSTYVVGGLMREECSGTGPGLQPDTRATVDALLSAYSAVA
jgi:hypothetical protein